MQQIGTGVGENGKKKKRILLKLFSVVLIIIGIGMLIPQNLKMPVVGATTIVTIISPFGMGNGEVLLSTKG